jgi:hypothetical protein
MMSYLVAVQAAPIYKWIDEKGRVHFSDRPVASTGEAEQTDLQTHIEGSEPLSETSPWTIQNQLEYLEQRRIRQAEERRRDRELQLQERALGQQEYSQSMPPIAVPPIVSVPYPVVRYYRYPGHPDKWSSHTDHGSGSSFPGYTAPRHSGYRLTSDWKRLKPITRPRIHGNTWGYDPHRGTSLNYQHYGDHHRFDLRHKERY